MNDSFDFSLPNQNRDTNPPSAMAAKDATRTPGSSADAQERPQKSGTDGGLSRAERRSRRRALISAPVRVRSLDVTNGGPDEISTTLDVSRAGLLFTTDRVAFQSGMLVAVTFPYSKSPVAVQAEQSGRVARVTKMPDGRFSVAVALRSGAGEDLVDNGGARLNYKPSAPSYSPELGKKKPLVLVVDKDSVLRASLKAYLNAEGYEVIALSSAAEAHHVLNMFTPALLIAEIEGDDLPGYELCAYVKGTPRLQTVPVMLMTQSAYPSDYANAHSLGAVICMAKPYRQERLGHVVRLLAPTARAKEHTGPARPADASRNRCAGNASKSPENPANGRFPNS